MTSPAQMYHDYFVPAIFAPWAPVLLDHARPARGERVLDVACGTGIIARLAAPMVGDAGEVVALDVSPPMLEVARTRPAPAGATIEWIERSAQSLPEREFDLLLCQQGLQFFPDPVGAVREMRRVVRDGGRAVVAVWQDLEHQPVYKALAEAEARFLDVPLADVGLPFMFERRHALDALFQEAGFDQVEVHTLTRPVTFPHPDRYVKLTLLAAAAVVPELADMPDDERDKLVDAVQAEVAPVLERYVNDDKVTFPMANNVVVAS